MKSRFLLSAALLFSFLSRAAMTLTVEAGDYDRRDTTVHFQLPPNAAAADILSGNGASLSLQTEGRDAWFVLRELKKGEKRTYKLDIGGVPELMAARHTNGEVLLTASGAKVFTYHTAKTEFPPDRPDLTPIYHRAGYIHPVMSPSGLQVTGDYPSNHKHHHGIWMAWTHTDFEGRAPDFWNMGDGKGTVEFVALDKTWGGPVHAGFIARHRYMDLTGAEPKAALNEAWTVRLYGAGAKNAKPYYVFDIDVKDECATAAPVKLPDYRYGGMCVRGNWAWNGKGKANVLTSEGETDAAKGDKNQVHARWVHLGGKVDGNLTGIAALAHPTNFRAPEPIRMNAAEPYFNFAPQEAGDMEITPEKPFTAKYRFVVADGAPDAAELNRLWNDYAHPPVVKVTQ